MAIESNPMQAALGAGRVQLGTWINLVRNPAVLTLLQAGRAGLRQGGHGALSPSMETVADMAVLGRALGFPVIVRPPWAAGSGSPASWTWGSGGCTSPRWTPLPSPARWSMRRYAPAGQRGMAGLGPPTTAPSGDPLRDQALLNEQVHLTVMLDRPPPSATWTRSWPPPEWTP